MRRLTATTAAHDLPVGGVDVVRDIPTFDGLAATVRDQKRYVAQAEADLIAAQRDLVRHEQAFTDFCRAAIN